MVDVAGVSCAGRLEEQYLDFFRRDRAMLDTAWHDQELARPDLLDMRAELDPEPAPHAEESSSSSA